MRPFTDVLRDHRNGKLVETLSERLTRIVKACKETRKKGKLKLELTIVPGDDDSFELVPNIAMTIPEKDLAKALFFGTDEGDLLRDSPNAPSLFRGADDMGSKPGTGGEERRDSFGG